MEKTRQRLFAHLLAAVLLLAAMPGVHARETSPPSDTPAAIRFYPAGEGTAQNPWQLAVPAHLAWINANPSRLEGYFLLMNDISVPTNVMIGRPASPFVGSFDGGGNTVTVNINLPGQDSLGFFGQIGEPGRVYNLTVAGRVAGRNLVGAFAGENFGRLINSRSDADVNGYLYVGGLAGMNRGMVRGSYASGAVSGSHWVGGLIGKNNASVISSYATGNVSGSENIGGLAGGNNGTVYSSYATGRIQGGETVGGLVGLNNRLIISSVALNTDIRGVVGPIGRVWGGGAGRGVNNHASSTTAVNGDFFREEADSRSHRHGQTVSPGTIATQAFWRGILGHDLGDTWIWSVSRNLPSLRSLPGGISEPLLGGGSEYDPWRLITPAHLEWIADPMYPLRLRGYFMLMNNISAPKDLVIGSADSPFSGSFYGNGYTITMDVYRPEQAYVGLFSRIEAGGRVHNLIIDGNIRGRHRVGGLAGESLGQVVNVNFLGNVRGEVSVGGLLGSNQGVVRESSATGQLVRGASRVGGLVGFNSGQLASSFATADVYGEWGIGGLVGRNDVDGEVVDSHATGNVLGHDSAVGGLVGASHGRVMYSYATGNVEGGTIGRSGVGGLVGGNWGSIISGEVSAGEIIGPPEITGRIWGTGSGSGQNNRVSSGTLVNGAPLPRGINNPDGQHGHADVNLTPQGGNSNQIITQMGLPGITRHNVYINGVIANITVQDNLAAFALMRTAITQIINNTHSGDFDNTVMFDLSDIENVTGMRINAITIEHFASAGLHIQVRMPQGTITLDSAAAAWAAAGADFSIVIELSHIDADQLNNAQRGDAGEGDDLLRVAVSSGGYPIRGFEGLITIAVPAGSVHSARVWYPSGNGDTRAVESTYDPVRNAVTFSTSYLPVYVMRSGTRALTAGIDQPNVNSNPSTGAGINHFAHAAMNIFIN